jgi:hypothetical protein
MGRRESPRHGVAEAKLTLIIDHKSINELVARLDNVEENCSCCGIDVERLGLKDKLDGKVEEGEKEVDRGQFRKCDALPDKLELRRQREIRPDVFSTHDCTALPETDGRFQN